MSRVVGIRRGAGPRGRQPTGGDTLLGSLFSEYWLASSYSGSGSWLGRKGIADLALPGGSANPTFCGHSTSLNPFGAGVDYVVLPGTASNRVTSGNSSIAANTDFTMILRCCALDWTSGGQQFVFGRALGLTSGGLINFTGAGLVQFWANDANSVSSSIAVTATDNVTGLWVKIEYRDSDRRVQIFTSTDATHDYTTVSWAQLGIDRTIAIDPRVDTSQPWSVGSPTGGEFFSGNVARAVVGTGLQSGGAMTMVADFNPAAGTFNATETTLTGTGDSLTWTINRSTSGRRAYAITRDAWWFGTDDYLSTADNALFDFGASQDFTIASLFRSIQDADSAYHTLALKRDTTTGTAGWSGGYVAGSGLASLETGATVEVADTATTVGDDTWNNPGTQQTAIFTRTAGATGTLTYYMDAVSVGGAGASAGDTSNALPVYVGCGLSNSIRVNFYEGLIYGFGISRTGLDATQVTTLDTELRSYA